MSTSTYANQVNRLTGDIAKLGSKFADERAKLADSDANATRTAQALRKAKTPAQTGRKGRELERHQKAAARHEKKAADLEEKITQKQHRLISAQAGFERAERAEQKKNDREAEKRRRANLDHIRELEQTRRAATALPEGLVARASMSVPASRAQFTETYDVCLSFAGEQRDYVERIAAELKRAGLDVFYDQDDDIRPILWGRDLGEFLDYVYRQASRFCVMFISADYATKAWAVHERRSALARAIYEGGEYVLPARFDDTELPGLWRTVGYLDLREIAPQTLVEFVLKKLSK